jgi:U3 small nucleolar RNA-associated protein 24
MSASPQISSALFFQFNQSLSPPYQVLIDTNFINFSIRKKIDIFRGMMDALYAKCIPMITDCVMAELEKLGPRYRIALRIARDEQIERVKCSHSGTYADDCLVARVMQVCYYPACDTTPREETGTLMTINSTNVTLWRPMMLI